MPFPNLGALFVKLAPFASIRTSSMTAENVLDLARVFDVVITPVTAQAIAQHAPRFSNNPEQTLIEFITSGSWLKMIAGQTPVKRGDLIRRCPYCEGLLIPPIEM